MKSKGDWRLVINVQFTTLVTAAQRKYFYFLCGVRAREFWWSKEAAEKYFKGLFLSEEFEYPGQKESMKITKSLTEMSKKEMIDFLTDILTLFWDEWIILQEPPKAILSNTKADIWAIMEHLSDYDDESSEQ